MFSWCEKLLKLLSQRLLMAALHATVHHTLGFLSPGASVFARDMLLDISFVADFIQLRDMRQALIHHNLLHENNRHCNFNYIVGDYVFELLKR